MKKIDLGQAITILANVGVIAGIVFLGIELRQNNELLEAESRSARSERAVGVFFDVAVNRDLAAVFAKLNEGEQLDSTDQVQLRWYALGVFRNFHANFDEIQLGNLDGTSVLQAQQSIVRNDGGAAPVPWHDYWQVYRQRSTPEFIEWVETYVFEAGR